MVSDTIKANNNQKKIPIELQALDECIYFSYYENLSNLIQKTPLYHHIINLINSQNHSDVDYAAHLILGGLQSGKYATINDIFIHAQSEAFPNPFINFGKKEAARLTIPNWLEAILANYSSQCTYSLKYESLTIKLNTGFETTAPLKYLHKVSAEKILTINSIAGLCRLMLELVTLDIQQSCNASSQEEVTNV